MLSSLARDAGYSSKDLCIRPRQPRPYPATEAALNKEKEAEVKLKNAVEKLEQQLRDALFARTTVHVGEQRILKNAFTKFDVDGSGNVDPHEFTKALEYLGLHTQNEGCPGLGGVHADVVKALFDKYDEDCSGQIDYDEFCTIVLKDATTHKLH